MKLLIALALGAAAHAADDLKEVNGHGRRLEALDGQIYSLETTFDVAGGRKLVEDTGGRKLVEELETTFNAGFIAEGNFLGTSDSTSSAAVSVDAACPPPYR